MILVFIAFCHLHILGGGVAQTCLFVVVYKTCMALYVAVFTKDYRTVKTTSSNKHQEDTTDGEVSTASFPGLSLRKQEEKALGTRLK